MKLLRLLCFIFTLSRSCRSEFVFANDKLIVDVKDDVLAAFGDFNSDKLIDIFVINNHGLSVDVLLQVQDGAFERHSLINNTGHANTFISGLMLGDFNGDVHMDLLVTSSIVSATKDEPIHVDVFLGNLTSLSVAKDGFVMKEMLRDHPLLCDYNADQLPDLLAETQPGVRSVWLSSRDKTFERRNFSSTEDNPQPFKIPASHAFVDINRDNTADIVISGQFRYEKWLNVDGLFVSNSSYDLPTGVGYVGQSSFGDFNQDGITDHLIPVCREFKENKCSGSEILVHRDDQWITLKSDFLVDDVLWEFVPPGSGPLAHQTNYSEPVTLVVGDYNIDGYPDILVIMTMEMPDPHNPDVVLSFQRAFLLDNVFCDAEPCKAFGRSFEARVHEPFNLIDDIIMAAFFDVYEDGILDIVMVYLTDENPRLLFLKNHLSEDAYFLKVLVVSGLCGDSDTCSQPYGVNIVGPNAFYQTTKTDGSNQISQATQLTQSAHFPLQLPYTVFGLGPTSNFIDKITIGIPRPPGVTTAVSRSWPQIIPNSQIFIIPQPLNDPSKWTAKLYVTPSHLVYLTGFALLGTCVFMAVIVGVLHWREKREDLLEKKQEAQKFHFDAM